MSDEFGSKEWLEQLQKLWNPMGIPIPSVSEPLIDPEEISKKITELQVVASWLRTNVEMVEMTIKTLEMQKSAIEALKENTPKPKDKK